jgi:hypothetical protein
MKMARLDHLDTKAWTWRIESRIVQNLGAKGRLPAEAAIANGLTQHLGLPDILL